LWLQPLICLSVLTAIVLNRFRRRGAWISATTNAIGILFLAGTVFSLPGAILQRDYKPFEFEQAKEVASLVSERDLVVRDWSSTAVVRDKLGGNPDHSLLFIDEAVVHGNKAANELDRVAEKTRTNDGKTYFVSLLDIREPEWDAFLGSRCGVRFEGPGPYRAVAREKARLRRRSGQITLWEVDPARIATSAGQAN
jgi:hypothetical protein